MDTFISLNPAVSNASSYCYIPVIAGSLYCHPGDGYTVSLVLFPVSPLCSTLVMKTKWFDHKA